MDLEGRQQDSLQHPSQNHLVLQEVQEVQEDLVGLVDLEDLEDQVDQQDQQSQQGHLASLEDLGDQEGLEVQEVLGDPQRNVQENQGDPGVQEALEDPVALVGQEDQQLNDQEHQVKIKP